MEASGFPKCFWHWDWGYRWIATHFSSKLVFQHLEWPKGGKKRLLFKGHLRSIAEGGAHCLSSIDNSVSSTSQHAKLNTFPIQPSTTCLLAGTRHSWVLVIFRYPHMEDILDIDNLITSEKAKHLLLLCFSLLHNLTSWERLTRKSRKKTLGLYGLWEICPCWIVTSWLTSQLRNCILHILCLCLCLTHSHTQARHVLKPEISDNLETGHSTNTLSHPPTQQYPGNTGQPASRGDTVPKQHIYWITFSLSLCGQRPGPSYRQGLESLRPKATINFSLRANFAHISADKSEASQVMQVSLPRPPMRSLEAFDESQLPLVPELEFRQMPSVAGRTYSPHPLAHWRSAPLTPTPREPVPRRWKEETCKRIKKDKRTQAHGLYLLT